MEFRNLFKKVFGDKKVLEGDRYEMLNTTTPYFAPYNTKLINSDIVKSAIRPIADAVGKLSVKHVQKKKINPQPYIKNILDRPNPFMSMQDFLTKMAWQRELTSNAFAYVKRDALGYPMEIYPIPYSSVELINIGEEVFTKFTFWTGKRMTVPYTDLMHLRKDFNSNDFFGDEPNMCLKDILEIVTTIDKGVVSAIRNSVVIKWLLKFKMTLQPEDREKQIEEFIKNYLDIEKGGKGVAASDPRYDIEQIKSDSAYLPNALQFKESKERIYSAFGVNDAIIQNKYTEEQWNAFYSSKIEPIAIQISDSMTNVLFTKAEKSFDNRIVCSASRLTFSSNAVKVAMARDLIPLGLFTINEMREVFELERVDGGDIRMQTLNIVNADKAEDYQGVKGKEEIKDGSNKEGDKDIGIAVDGKSS